MDLYHFDTDPYLEYKKISTFFFIFFNQIYNTQNYDFFCYLLAFYSYTYYINQKSDLLLKILSYSYNLLCATLIHARSVSWLHDAIRIQPNDTDQTRSGPDPQHYRQR